MATYTKVATFDSSVQDNVCDELDTELSNIETAVNGNDASITTNAANIATNTANIATNVTNIATNATDIDNLETFVGYESGLVAVGYSEFLINQDSDATTVFEHPTYNQPTCSVVVPANTAPDGVKMIVAARLGNSLSELGDVVVSPAINGTALSTEATKVYQYELEMGSSTAASQNASRVMVYLTADGWDSTIANTITLTCYRYTGGSYGDGAEAYAFNLMVWGLKART